MSQKREARLRREFLYRKTAQTQPYYKLSSQRENQATLLNEAALAPNRDDTYATAGEFDPRVLITTSRDPSCRLTTFLKEMKLLIPNATRMNRGSSTMPALVETCTREGVSDLIVLSEVRGRPDGLTISHFPHGPTIKINLRGVVLRADVPCGNMGQAFPHLIFEGFESDIGKRVVSILKHIFPVPKEESQRVVVFSCTDDVISFRHYV